MYERLTHRLKLSTFTKTTLLIVVVFAATQDAHAKRRRAPAGGRAAIVADERLAALRAAPDLSADLLQRLRRGRAVSVRGSKTADGVIFYRVASTSRTIGWMQAEALIFPSRAGDDLRLLSLIRGSEGFDRIERAALFLEIFPRSRQRPAALALLAEAAEEAAKRLTRDAASRLDAREMAGGGAPSHTYFLNYSGLDRFNRAGVKFAFDRATKQLRYDGAAWREIVRRHPQSEEAARARARLEALTDAGASLR